MVNRGIRMHSQAGAWERGQTLIEETKARVAITINSALTLMYWHIGKKINDEILKHERAEYGKEIVSTLSRQLIECYGNGYSAKNLRHLCNLWRVKKKVKG